MKTMSSKHKVNPKLRAKCHKVNANILKKKVQVVP